MPSARIRQLPVILLAAFGLAMPLAAQTTTPAAGGTPPTQPAAQPTPAPSPLNFSGVVFGSYNYLLSTDGQPFANQTNNSFTLDRAYLTFRMLAGDRTSIRITTDVYQTNEAAQSGTGTTYSNNAYTIRAKYAYLQYDAPRSSNGAQLTGRIGILQNVVIDHIESFWPRYLSQTAVERAGFFASADAGVAGQLTLPNKMGEVYATIVNGPGYTSRENDRFKDFSARLSLTPLANQTSSPLFQTFTITGWGYKGAKASRYVNGGAGQVGAVGQALDRSRYGVFLGLRDPRLVLGAEYAQRHDEDEPTGANTVAVPRTVNATTGRVLSGFTVVRPFAFANGMGKSPFGLVARYDRVSPTASTENIATPPSTSNSYHNIIAGLFYDISQKAQLALDYQESLASNNGVSARPPAQSKGYYAHFVVNF
jgi:hypothetical protein